MPSGEVTEAPVVVVRVTDAPADGAGPVRVTVPVNPVPPVTEGTEVETDDAAEASTRSPVDFVTPPATTEMVAS